PHGSVIKSTSIDPAVVDPDGVYRKTGPAKVFTTEKAAIAAIKQEGTKHVVVGDVLVLCCRGPLGKLRDGDRIQIVIDRNELEGSIDLVGDASAVHDAAWGTAEFANRSPRPDLAADPQLPADTRLWALLQNASGGVWGGCVYDADAIAKVLSDRPSHER